MEKNQILIAMEFIANIIKSHQIELSKSFNISPIQLQILEYIRRNGGSTTLTKLNEEFKITKATLSDSLKNLFFKEFIIKDTNPDDARSNLILLNYKNKDLAELFEKDSALNQTISEITTKKQSTIINSLISLLSEMEAKSIISKRRMCFSCTYYQLYTDNSFYCKFLDKTFENHFLKSDCIDFKPQKKS